MYRVIIASTEDNVSKLVDKILDFINTQFDFARQHSFLLHELPTKSFTRTISGKQCVFTLKKGILTITCLGDILGTLNLHQGCKSVDVTKLVEKAMKKLQE